MSERQSGADPGAARWPLPPRGGMLVRALTRRCLICGSSGIFTGFFALAERCPNCQYSFEREEGYWTGAMILNIGGAQLAFFAFFLGGLVLTWPDPPWNFFLVGGLALMALFPVLFYPWSKTLWLWGDLCVRGPSTGRE
ncbi:MAG: DUF983 domain-containing protein [Egibacteraceae bacterium]